MAWQNILKGEWIAYVNLNIAKIEILSGKTSDFARERLADVPK